MPRHRACVLIVEDDADIRDAVAGALEAEGYTVICAANGQEALAILEKGAPCVVLLDLMMPVMNGWDFMRNTRATHRYDDMPVVVVSAYSQEPAEGVRRVLKKPLDIRQLLGAVQEYCCCAPGQAEVQH